ncbi:short-chain dehydrogenase [Paracoccus acridae]|uniref:Short-chain dehydrogenase n=1 Tax=Paracoccus acridae TaxID=1795310 RepID=A0ABQ1VLK4_9RHOB|nr:SDR family oxidoreductase [Paracoccus acridae]GGF73756.1 short-chain dehydrogenase [Paracoccus acridae]
MDGISQQPRIAVITGASAGVGRAVAREFAAHGWRLGLVARGRAGLEGARADAEERGGEALVLPADVADAGAVDDAAQAVMDRWGRIDLWINAAMATVLAPVSQVTPDEFRRVTEVTYLGQVFGTQAALRHMRAQGRGTIVSIGSALAYRGIPLQAPYCAAKFATRGFMDSLRTELLHENSPIRLTEIHLPAVNTPQFDWARNKMPRKAQPVPPIHSPEAIARAVYRASLDAPREVWLAGSAVKAILGDAAAPALVDRILSSQGYSGQQTEEAAHPRPDNLFAPMDADRDHGASGRFGDDARSHVTAYRPGRLRGGAAAIACAVGCGILWTALSGRNRS